MSSGPALIRGRAGEGKRWDYAVATSLSAKPVTPDHVGGRLSPGRALRAAGLAAAGDVDLLLERGEPDGADHDLLADDVARRAVEAERLGDLHVLIDRGAHLVGRHVLLQARHVEAGLLGGRERVRQVGLTAAAEQPLVEIEVLLARVLHADRDRDLGGLDR